MSGLVVKFLSCKMQKKFLSIFHSNFKSREPGSGRKAILAFTFMHVNSFLHSISIILFIPYKKRLNNLKHFPTSVQNLPFSKGIAFYLLS